LSSVQCLADLERNLYVKIYKRKEILHVLCVTEWF